MGFFTSGIQDRLRDLAAIPGPAAQEALNNLEDGVLAAAKNYGPEAERIVRAIAAFPEFQWHYIEKPCFRAKVNALYKIVLQERAETAPKIDWWGPFGRSKSELEEKAASLQTSRIYIFAAEQVYRKKLGQAQRAILECWGQDETDVPETTTTQTNPDIPPPERIISPFDRRMDKLFLDSDSGQEIHIPFDTRNKRVSTIGHVVSDTALRTQYNYDNEEDMIRAINNTRLEMAKSDFYTGVDSMINSYSMTKLYGSRGGEYILDQKNQRRWYEIDTSNTNKDLLNYSKNPTLSSIISWGNGDPFGRTPYHFTDFAFSKHWNVIPNNRLITLRRFAAPILDNMRFPGIENVPSGGDPGKSNESIANIGNNGLVQQVNKTTNGATAGVNQDGGDSAPVSFPPMATAITYFGEDTGNNLSDLLKFSTGLEWGEVKADLHTPRPSTTPDMDQGAGGLSSGLTKYAKMFNIATGNYNQEAILNKGALPPDPYVDGPYENRIIGPVNRIQAVKKREPGLKFEHPLDLTFEYVARPIGGVNPKAALLEILSNFLVIGSASAVFWGGQHRFMGDPIRYPFIGGDKGIQKWYKGDPVGWGQETISQFATGVESFGNLAADFFKQLLGAGQGGDLFGGIKNLLTGKSLGGNALRAVVAEKSAGQIPYLSGMKALLIGEPVGDWHVTIGNPFNPIAMIGNLICTGIDIEFGNELGPDDFPLEMKVVVHLDHGMARDRDAIQSIFNRGMGRIYELPEDFKGSADFTTGVDNQTKDANRSETGYQPVYYKVPIANSGTVGGKYGNSLVRDNALGGAVSVWNRAKFSARSPNQVADFSRDKILSNRSAFRAGTWIGLKSIK